MAEDREMPGSAQDHERDHGGERGLVPSRSSRHSETYWRDWQTLREMREYLDAVFDEMKRLEARDAQRV